MIVSLLELFAGVVLVVGSTVFLIRRAYSVIADPHDWKKRLREVLCLIVIDVMGVHLLIDALVPGHALVHIHAPRSESYPIDTLRVLTAPVRFTGESDLNRSTTGRFTSEGTFSTLVVFRWGERRMYYRVYDDSRRDVVIADTFARVSPYARLGLVDKHIYLPDRLRPSSTPR